MLILGIDPGTTESGVITWYPHINEVGVRAVLDNEKVLNLLRGSGGWDEAAIIFETMTPYAAGYTTMHTLIWLGRFMEALASRDVHYQEVTRQAVVKHVCGKKAKGDKRGPDARVREALIRRFPATGGGKIPQIGTKGKPGLLYGMSGHMWAALAVAITWGETSGG